MKVSARLVPVVVALAAVVPTAGTAHADSAATSLPMNTFARVVADTAHGRVFYSPGGAGSVVAVTDLDGVGVGRIASLPGATGLALTPDGSSLWVALAKGDALARVDTATLTVAQTVALPAATCPGDVAVVGSRVVYGYSCNTYGGSGGYGGIGVVDTATGAVLGTTTTGPFYRPTLATGPAGQVFVADGGLSPATLYQYDVSGPGAPTLVASRRDVGSNLRDLAASPDGSTVVLASGSPYEYDVFLAGTLAGAGVYPGEPYPLAAAWSADGSTLALGQDAAYQTDLYLYPAGSSTPTRSVDLGSGRYLQPRGLAIAPDGSRAWAVSGDVYGGTLTVTVVTAVGSAASSLTAAADPPKVYPGQSTQVGGRLTSGTAGVPGATLTVTRRDSTHGTTQQLPPVTTRSDGTYVFPDTVPSGVASYAYDIGYAGDPGHTPATASAVVDAVSTAPSLSLTLSQSGTGSADVSGVVRLTYSGTDSPAGVTVHVSRASGDQTVALPDLVTDANGGAKLADTAPAGSSTYQVSVDATAVHEAATASRTVSVLSPTSLTLTTSQTAVDAGSTVQASGVLTSGGSALGGREVQLLRSGCGTAQGSSTTVAVGSAVTTAAGSWTVSDQAVPAGTCNYLARFAGDSSYAASQSTTVAVTVQRRSTSLGITATRGTGKDKKSVTVVATLGTTHTNRVVTITATTGGTTVTLGRGPVDGSGRLAVTYSARSTTTYTVIFDGDDWYLPETASTTL